MEHPIYKLMQLMGILDLFGEQNVPSDVKYIKLICSDVLQKLRATLQQNYNLQYWEDVFELVKQIARLTQYYKDARGEAAEQINRCAMQLFKIIEQVIVVGTSYEAGKRDLDAPMPGCHYNIALEQQAQYVYPAYHIYYPYQIYQIYAAYQLCYVQDSSSIQPSDFEQEMKAEMQHLKSRLAATENRCSELESYLRAAVTLISAYRKSDCGLYEARQNVAGQMQSYDYSHGYSYNYSQGRNWGQNYTSNQVPSQNQTTAKITEQKASQKSPSLDYKFQPKQQITFYEVPAFYAQSKPRVYTDPNYVSYAMTRSSVGIKQREPASGVLYLQDDLPQPLRAKSGQRLPSSHAAKYLHNLHELPQNSARTGISAIYSENQPEISPIPRAEPVTFVNYFK